MILRTSLVLLLSLVLPCHSSSSQQHPLNSPSTPESSMSRAASTIYDALVIGSGPAGLSSALTLARICRSSIIFDTGEFRNQGAKEMHTFLSRDGIPPEKFRSIARQQIEDKYSDQVTFVPAKIVAVSNTEVAPGYKGFQAVDSLNNTYLGRKLVLATGVEDVLPTDIEGYKENWPQHMQVPCHHRGNFASLLTLFAVISVPFAMASNKRTIPSACSPFPTHPTPTSP